METVFDGDDNAYQAWLAANPNGYVLNTRREVDPLYMVLHRASCPTIREYTDMAQEGGFTERAYIKVCADSVSALRNWVRTHGRPDGTFSNECGRCVP
jgi:hypothetical protein